MNSKMNSALRSRRLMSRPQIASLPRRSAQPERAPSSPRRRRPGRPTCPRRLRRAARPRPSKRRSRRTCCRANAAGRSGPVARARASRRPRPRAAPRTGAASCSPARTKASGPVRASPARRSPSIARPAPPLLRRHRSASWSSRHLDAECQAGAVGELGRELAVIGADRMARIELADREARGVRVADPGAVADRRSAQHAAGLVAEELLELGVDLSRVARAALDLAADDPEIAKSWVLVLADFLDGLGEHRQASDREEVELG